MKKLRKIQLPMYYKIMLSFLGLISVLLMILQISSVLAQNNAEQYFEERMTTRVDYAIQHIVDRMASEGWTLEDQELIDYIERYAIQFDLKLEVFDLNERSVFNNVSAPKSEPAEGGAIKVPQEPITFRTERFDIVYDSDLVGYVQVRYFDAKNIGQQEERFFGRNSEVFRNAIIGTLLITLVVSFLIARSITKPLKKVSETAVAISEGHLKVRTDVKSSTTEIVELSKTINHMATTLEREDILRKQLTSDMAHEIRTPLTSLRNFFEAFIDGVYEPNELNMTRCHDEIIRLSELVDKLKDLASIEETLVKPNKSMVNLSEEVTTMGDLLLPEFQKKNLSLNLDLEEKVMVNMDQNHFRQMITNLLTNAKRYTDEGGVVTVRLYKEKTYAIMSVEDTGVGIDEKDRLNIFERFYRADKSRDRATGGLGVGLTIVKTLVETYDGSIGVESVLGQGSTFTVKLPCVTNTPKA